MLTPAIILIRPQLGENIGAAARVMANFGLRDLRLVAPRDGWPNGRAEPLSAGAFDGHVEVTVHATTAEAAGDLNYVIAATARPREVWKPVFAPRDALIELRKQIASDRRVGVLYGTEKAGLSNEDVGLADAIVTYPVNTNFSSLNLAQSVAVFAYEWAAGVDVALPEGFDAETPDPAVKSDLDGLMVYLEDELDAAGFFWPPLKAEQMKRNLRGTFARAGLTTQEVSTLRGAMKAIAEGPRRRAREAKAKADDAARRDATTKGASDT